MDSQIEFALPWHTPFRLAQYANSISPILSRLAATTMESYSSTPFNNHPILPARLEYFLSPTRLLRNERALIDKFLLLYEYLAYDHIVPQLSFHSPLT
jgi:hypothetical protein